MSLDFFVEQLEPYGGWHTSASYGRVWIPRVQVIGWHPYTHGHWVYTDFGWTWVSDYEWGAIPFHYGTWAIDPELGWAWVPGYVWAPAWVVYRSGPSYIGWAPVPPSFSIGAPFGFEQYGPDQFVFVRAADFLAPDVQRFAVPIQRTRVVFNETSVIGDLRIDDGVVVNRAPDVREIERVAGKPVPRAPIDRVPKLAPVAHPTREALRVPPELVERGQVRAAAPTTDRAAVRPRPEREPRGRGQEPG
jgi:hypothetical protein